MSNINTHEMKDLRIEEGRRIKIGQTGNPLDGTWTRPDPMLVNLLFIERVKQIWIFFFYMAILTFVVFVIESRILAFLILALLMVASFASIIYAYWAAQLSYRNHRFRITDEELVVESGAISLNKTLIPLSNIYEVNTVEGYWHRKYGIKSVMVGGYELMGLSNGDEVAEAILARVKLAKAKVRAEL